VADEFASVKVTGLRELRTALKKVGAEAPAAMKTEMKTIAGKVVGKIVSKVPQKTGKAAGSIKARGTTTGAGIAFGGTAAPYYPWLDFGGTVGKGHKPGVSGSGSIRRNFIKQGRYVYPTLMDEQTAIKHDLDEALGRLASQAGFETKEGA
jgi:Bacteriophage HK97-gp10, putative tail-component